MDLGMDMDLEVTLDVSSRQVGWYLRNCLKGAHGEALFSVIEEYAEILHRQLSGGDDDDDEEPGVATKPAPKLSRERRMAEVRQFLARFTEHPGIEGAIEGNVLFLAEEFDLSELDAAILLVVVRYDRNHMLESFCDALHEECASPQMAFAAMLGERQDAVTERLQAGAPLIDNGVLVVDRSGDCLCGGNGAVHMAGTLVRAMRKAHDSRADLIDSLLGKPQTASLMWEDFSHLGPSAELAARALVGWRDHPVTGFNLMLYGPPGTGKTEFASVLAAKAGYQLWSTGEADDYGHELSRAERIAALRLAQAVVRHKRNAILLADEAEDMLQSATSGGAERARMSKSFVNRTLSETTVPVIWTCNDTGSMDPATLRRMMHLIEMRVPDLVTRQRIWGRVLEREELTLDAGAPARLAGHWMAPASAATNAARMARLAGGGEAEVEVALLGAMRALGLPAAVPERTGAGFDAELTMCADDLDAMAAQVCRAGAPRSWSICISGPPGTGKSEYARYLAHRMGMPTHHVKVSSVISKWVGESERNIAAAFAEARSRNAMLVFDEADSLLRDRSLAQQSWEVTQVNEMLTCMEDHPLPFAATTNALMQVDLAAMRRFTFKLRFDNLDERRAALAFRRFLGGEPPGALPLGLAPGDFITVRRKLGILGPQPPHTLLRWLLDEVEAKRGAIGQPIGFQMAAPLQSQAVRPPRG